MPGSHNQSAPCRRNANLIYAEELLYQDFRIRLPRFVNVEQKSIYLQTLRRYTHLWLRGRVIDNYAYFLNQRGQNLVYANVSYAGRPALGKWSPDSCLSYGSHHHVDAFPPWDGDAAAPAAIFVSSPDDYSFQHFLDRVAIMLAQTRHLGKPDDWKYITSRPASSTVRKLWSLLVPSFNQQTLLSPRNGTQRTRLLVYPCQTPLIHPYTQQLASELLRHAAGYDPRIVVPIQSRSLVLLMARRGSRQWVNEGECRQGIEATLQNRGRGEQLVVFDSYDYKSYADVVALGTRVKIVVGVHGGALNNLVFMQPGTGVVEICPVSRDERTARCSTTFWETASVLHMPYWNVVATNTTAVWQVMVLDCELVLAAVEEALVNLEALPSPLEAFYQGSSFG